MFRKAHLFFTILCGGSTAAIMIVMSLFYLRVSESNLRASRFQSFQNDIGTIAANLEQSTYVSMQWLARLEAQNDYIIYVVDNGVPFLHNSLSGSIDSHSQSLLQESLAAYDDLLEIQIVSADGSSYSGIWHVEYPFVSPTTGESYYAALIDIERDTATTRIAILYSLAALSSAIRQQRTLFLWIDLSACAALFVFAWFFTGRLLRPLRENHEKQLQFIAAASHELRTPLSVILASSECCGDASAEERKVFEETIRKEGRRMNSLIDDMLSLTRSGMSSFPIRREPVEPDTLCLNAYESFEPLCRAKNLTLSLVLPDAPIARCSCDRDRIAQVLSILLHNAVSYTPEGGHIELALRYRRERRTAFEITVTDTGIGISDEDKPHIFDRFYRAEKSRSTKDHFGLGLSIAYEIVSAHRGSISMRDNPGGGSIFTVRLP